MGLAFPSLSPPGRGTRADHRAFDSHGRFWRAHSSYILQAAQLRDQTNALQTRYEHDVHELEKLQKTNVYSTFLPFSLILSSVDLEGSAEEVCPADRLVGMEQTTHSASAKKRDSAPSTVCDSVGCPTSPCVFSLSFLPPFPANPLPFPPYLGAPQVPWPEINAAWGHTLLLLHTIARKFGYQRFEGWRLWPVGSFSWIEKLSPGGEGKGERLEL